MSICKIYFLLHAAYNTFMCNSVFYLMETDICIYCYNANSSLKSDKKYASIPILNLQFDLNIIIIGYVSSATIF